MPRPPTICNATTLRSLSSCLDCFSVTDLDRVEAYLWGLLAGGTPPTVDQILTDTDCLTCFSKKQLMEARVAALLAFVQTLHPTVTLATILEAMKCAKCAKPRQLQAAIVYFFCNYFNGPQD